MLVNFMKEHVRKYGFRILVGYSNTEDCLKHETYSLLNRCFSCIYLHIYIVSLYIYSKILVGRG